MRSAVWPLLIAGLTGFSATSARAQGSCQYYVAPPPLGSNANPGSAAQPWATLDWASSRVLALGGANCTVSFADGVYTGANSLYERFATTTTFRAANPYRAVLQNNGTRRQPVRRAQHGLRGLRVPPHGARARAPSSCRSSRTA